jgi:hypothetical protein
MVSPDVPCPFLAQSGHEVLLPELPPLTQSGHAVASESGRTSFARSLAATLVSWPRAGGHGEACPLTHAAGYPANGSGIPFDRSNRFCAAMRKGALGAP